MNISGFQKQSLIDYPGKIASVVFTQGCNLSCPYCHNRQLIPAGQGIIAASETLDYFRRNNLLLDAVVITGGEPTLQKDLSEYISAIKQTGLKVKLDTNGTNPRLVARLLGMNLIDYVAMDVKSQLTEETYSLGSGVKISAGMLERICESVKLIIQSGIDHEFRTTVCRELVSFENIRAICRDLDDARKYFIQQYHSNPEQEENDQTFSAYALNEIQNLVLSLKGKLPVYIRE